MLPLTYSGRKGLSLVRGCAFAFHNFNTKMCSIILNDKQFAILAILDDFMGYEVDDRNNTF